MSEPQLINPASSPVADAKHHLPHGNVGLVGVVMTVVACAAPLGAVAGFVSLVIGFGNGPGAPAAFVIAALLCLVSAIGYGGMSRRIPKGGAFYTFVSAGLGRPAGLGVSFVCLATYFLGGFGLYVFLGLITNDLFVRTFGMSSPPWWVWAVALWAVITGMTYFNIEFSSRTFIVIIAVEIILLLVFDLTVLFKGGAEGLSLEPFSLDSMTSGSLAIGVLFAMLVFQGFEATALYRDEARDPEKNIPRATYAAVILLGAIYVLSTYALVMAYGSSQVKGAALENPAELFSAATSEYLGDFSQGTLAILLVTSMFGACLAVQNLLTRYIHSLSADTVLPHYLAGVKPRHGAPYRAAFFVALCYLAGIVSAAIFADQPEMLYGQLVGASVYGFIFAILVCDVAQFVYFWKRRTWDPVNRYLVSSAISSVGLAVALYLASNNFDLVFAGSEALTNMVIGMPYILIALGVVVALVIRQRNVGRYNKLGRNTV